MNTPNNLKYTKTHEWVLFADEKNATVGLTAYAQNSLGSIVFVNLPDVGSEVCAGQSLGDVESVKTVSEVISPVSGTVARVNSELLDAPQRINEDAYGSWLVEITEISGHAELLDASDYETYCGEVG